MHFSEQTSIPCMSVSPWPHHQSPGGGAVIPCSYIIQVHSDHQQGLGKVCDAVEEMAENSVTKVNAYQKKNI